MPSVRRKNARKQQCVLDYEISPCLVSRDQQTENKENDHVHSPLQPKILETEKYTIKNHGTTGAKPLASIRDPRRHPLLVRLPFAPFSHSVKKKNDSIQRNIVPAYAYKESKTGLLEIQTVNPPKPHFVDIEHGISKNGNILSAPSLYPVAVNGGGIGVYNDPRDFATGGISGMSKNNHEPSRVPTRSFITFPWNLGESTYSIEKEKKTRMSFHQSDETVDRVLDIELNKIEDRRGKTCTVQNSPWRVWEHVHNSMVRIAESTQGLTGHDDNTTSMAEISSALPATKRKARISSIYNDDDFDFALILQPKQVYAYWAGLLDFRAENGIVPSSNGIAASKRSDRSDSLEDFEVDYSAAHSFRNRKRRRHNELTSPLEGDGKLKLSITPPRRRLFSPNTTTSMAIDESGKRAFNQRVSLFDKAIAEITPPRVLYNSTEKEEEENLDPQRLANAVRRSPDERPTSKSSHKRNKTLTSTPVHTLRPVQSQDDIARTLHSKNTEHKLVENRHVVDDYEINPRHLKRRKDGDKDNPNCLEIEDIPTQVIPRGIAARTNGMDEFLSALKRGIVLRRHRQHSESVFIKLISVDGGDTIKYIYMHPREALIALKEQKVRFNKIAFKDKQLGPKGVSKRWSRESESTLTSQESEIHNFSLPDYIAAEKYRGTRSNGIKKTVMDATTKVSQSGTFKAADIVAVHRAVHRDPYSLEGEAGTYSLRQTESDYYDAHTFSIILPAGIGWVSNRTSLKSASEKWFHGVGSENSFRYIDMEAATEGEYWMIFRGFLLLQRDAASGRFAAQRASGFSSNCNKLEIQQRWQEMEREHQTSTKVIFREPEETTCTQRMYHKVKLIMFGEEDEKEVSNPTPPPSDFFLGFKSPGTQIWSRLRQAGLETHRIHALDTSKVMIKIRCPSDRLMDVAEVLRLKLRKSDGFYEPFQEVLLHEFLETNEDNCSRNNNIGGSTLFRSSDRQNIIDYIIKSRIRNSGAELGERGLGKDIESRVPLHMHARLESLFQCWVLYYQKVNWEDGRDGKSMKVEFDESSRSSQNAPSILTRFVVGSFYQPIDSIEQYFGEKVAFYFAWLQHSTFYLIFPSILGLAIFICQIRSNQFDHPVRPYFASVIMIWSFLVLVSWRQRQNYLAHRWGTMNFKEIERNRPQYHGVYKQDEITEEWIIHYPAWKRWIKYCISIPLTVAFTVLSSIGILLFYVNRDIILAKYFGDEEEDIFNIDWSISVLGKVEAIGAVSVSKEHLSDPQFWYIIAGFPIVLGLSLPILNALMMQVSKKLNDFENYRTETQYQNALIVKVIAFRFVAYFAALYFYAYVATGTDEEVIENGILRVATCLIVYLTVSHWWSVFLAVYLPLLILRWKLYRCRLKLRQEVRVLEQAELDFLDDVKMAKMSCMERIDTEKKLTNQRLLLEQAQNQVWEEMMMPNYDPFFDYIQAVINFAYVVCFSAVLPITPCFVLINQLMNMRLNAYKICRGRRRPLAQKTGGIGVWEHVLHMISVIAVMTNCSLMGLTSAQFHYVLNTFGHLGLFGVIVGWEHVMLLIKYLMQSNCSSYPSSVLNAIRLETFIRREQRNNNIRVKNERRSFHHS